MLVEVMGERSVADVVQQAGDADRLDHQRLGRDGILRGVALGQAVGQQHLAQRRIQGARP